MYSRNRMPSGEERYQNNLPPVYSGNRFRPSVQTEGIPVTDTRSEPPQRLQQDAAEAGIPEAQPAALPPPQPEAQSDTAEESTHAGAGKLKALTEGIFSSIGQEELILIALLLLLCAEHERSMDVIVILLLLISIK